MREWIYKYLGWICCSIIIIMIIAPSFISGTEIECLTKCGIFRNTDFSKTGQIGDTIGGITAPFIGILSIILLYFTFYEQRKFNKDQNINNRMELLQNIQNKLKETLDSLSIHGEEPDKTFSFNELTDPNPSSIKISIDEGHNLLSVLNLAVNYIKICYELNNESTPYKKAINTDINQFTEKIIDLYDKLLKKDIEIYLTANNFDDDDDDDDDNKYLNERIKEEKTKLEKIQEKYKIIN